jgi:UDP-N-acetylglucosamine transferase subunit ALG13
LIKPKKILVAPLNWGLGHATRCIPIIHALLQQGASVYVASDGAAFQLLKKEFPDLPIFELPAYNVRYIFTNMVLSMALQMPKILRGCVQEYFWLKRFIKTHGIDIVISDNRYGFFNKSVYSIFMTHQVNIQAPFSFIVNGVNRFWIKKFDICWIPDFEYTPNLAGELAHGGLVKSLKTKYLGALSRLKKYDTPKRYKAIFVLSGPEPQRTLFENKIISQLKNKDFSTDLFVLVRGVTDGKILDFRSKNLRIHNYLTTKDLNQKILESDILIARSGYSTIMDLAALGIKAILVPTPGQTEQEYLAQQLAEQKLFFTQKQAEMDLTIALEEVKSYAGFGNLFVKEDTLNEIIMELLKI